MRTITTVLNRLATMRSGNHRGELRREQVRAQETFNAQIRGYGNNNAGNRGFPSNFTH